MKTVKFFLLAIFLLVGISSYSQGRHPHGRRHGRVVVVKRSPYRPKKMIIYHPVWRPAWACSRRWVYFPRYNFYWDNWRNHYVFLSSGIWVSQAAAPPVVANINIADEKHYEMKEGDDDNDDIAQYNTEHQKEYKAE
jgi:hypothetical protein